MRQHQRHQESKLAHREISTVGGMPTLLSADAHAHPGLVNHAHIVRAVPDSQSNRVAGAALIILTNAAFCRGDTRHAITVGMSCTASIKRVIRDSCAQSPSSDVPSSSRANSSLGEP
eukprot:CAMPEP_0173350014 /NCGR_PEP_ID=MMETSP1144-20121109/14639_1 /TAXON_ID=483371 /ORGANISM="non described non described, Strain CCMP2298" /LENGTH=116 /DNA_ID=CAMNT_0014297895 /DNA_START=777 /DNA_END=1124 /DNA_ORIENTATION=-